MVSVLLLSWEKRVDKRVADVAAWLEAMPPGTTLLWDAPGRRDPARPVELRRCFIGWTESWPAQPGAHYQALVYSNVSQEWLADRIVGEEWRPWPDG